MKEQWEHFISSHGLILGAANCQPCHVLSHFSVRKVLSRDSFNSSWEILNNYISVIFKIIQSTYLGENSEGWILTWWNLEIHYQHFLNSQWKLNTRYQINNSQWTLNSDALVLDGTSKWCTRAWYSHSYVTSSIKTFKLWLNLGMMTVPLSSSHSHFWHLFPKIMNGNSKKGDPRALFQWIRQEPTWTCSHKFMAVMKKHLCVLPNS